MSNLTIDEAPETKVGANSDIASHAGASFFCQKLVEQFGKPSPTNVLIAGCGEGHEAAAIQQYFDTSVEAVDVDEFFLESFQGQERLNFRLASVCELPFEDNSFDAIFYHHVIEHVDDPAGSIQELRRVLNDDGILFIGTPNRSRLISSVGAHAQSEWKSTFRNKLKDNIRDWQDRCRGTFRNECGAHAGFTRKELDAMLDPWFTQRTWVTEEYLRFKYADHRFSSVFKLAAQEPWSGVLAPSVYVFAQL